jgi:hypothetical protein
LATYNQNSIITQTHVIEADGKHHHGHGRDQRGFGHDQIARGEDVLTAGRAEQIVVLLADGDL